VERICARLRAAVSLPAAWVTLAFFALMLLFRMGFTPAAGSLENRIGNLLSQIEGAGKVDVVIRTQSVQSQTGSSVFGGQDVHEIPCGAIAVVQGEDNAYVRLQVSQALCALLGLQAAQVSVLSAEGG